VNNNNFFCDGRWLGNFLGWLGSEAGGDRRIGPDDLFLEPFGTDFVEGARGDFSGGNAQFLGLRENFFVLEAKLLCDVVDTNGHNYFSLPPTGMCDSPAWLIRKKMNDSVGRHKF